MKINLLLAGTLALIVLVPSLVTVEYYLNNSQTSQAEKPIVLTATQAQQNTQLSSQTNNESPTVKPLFLVNVTYAVCSTNESTGSDFTPMLYGSTIEADVNFTVVPAALKNADMRTEYYRFEVSSNRGPILNVTYYITEYKTNSPLQISQTGEVTLANGMSSSSVIYNSGQTIIYASDNSTFVTGHINANVYGTNPKNLPPAVTAIQYAQTLYIDVTRLSTVIFNGNGTVTTLTCNQTLQHITLIKDNGFEYGKSYWINLPAEGLMPSSVETDNATVSVS